MLVCDVLGCERLSARTCNSREQPLTHAIYPAELVMVPGSFQAPVCMTDSTLPDGYPREIAIMYLHSPMKLESDRGDPPSECASKGKGGGGEREKETKRKKKTLMRRIKNE
jgi:hypothetical protein